MSNMFLLVSLIGAISAFYGARLLRLKSEQRTLLETISALILLTVGIFILISGLVITWILYS